MSPPDGLSGGDKLLAWLNAIDRRLAASSGSLSVSVGFMEGSTYPDGTSIPQVAATNEFGGTIERKAGTTTIYRKVAASGTHFLRNGKFVKKSASNFASTHAHDAYTITIPPRPFFRTMIKDKASTWGADMAALLKSDDYDAEKTLGLMGERIKGQLQASIKALTSPPNAPSTVRKKGAAKPLIDTGVMWNSVDYQVST